MTCSVCGGIELPRRHNSRTCPLRGGEEVGAGHGSGMGISTVEDAVGAYVVSWE